MPIDVEDRDLGFDSVRRELKWLEGKSVAIGWQGQSGLESPGETAATLVDIATFQEFGTRKDGRKHIPPRPMLRLAFEESRAEIDAFIDRELGRVMTGEQKARRALNRIGLKGVAVLQAKIRKSPTWATALAESTIEARTKPSKKSVAAVRGDPTKPLIDTAAMLNAVTWAILDEGRIIEQGGASG